MFAATDISLISLIENKQVIYTVVDYMDTYNTELVNERVYIQAVRDLIQTKTKKTDKQRLAKIFDLDNLLSAGLIIEIDKTSRNILFHSAVIEVFRLFDSKRLKELSNADLQDLSARLDNARENLLTHISTDAHVSGMQDLEEQIEMVFLLLSDISSKLQTNTRSLQSKAWHLAEIIDANNELTVLEDVKQKHQTLAEVQKIYHRNILPMLEFLNEYEHMKGGLSPLKKISAIHDIFDDFSYLDEAYRVQQYKIGITTHYKTIEEISHLLERYSNQAILHRKQYNAIEKAYQSLVESAAVLSDGKLNTHFFKDDDIIFNVSYPFFGIKHHRSAQKSLINWADINHHAYLEEYLLNAQQRRLDEAVTADAKKLSKQDGVFERWQENQRKSELKQFTHNLHFEQTVDDIYLEIYKRMIQQLSHVNLSEILFVSKQLQFKMNITYQVYFEQPQLTLTHHLKHPVPHQKQNKIQKLTYWRRELII